MPNLLKVTSRISNHTHTHRIELYQPFKKSCIFCRRAYKELHAHIILATFLSSFWSDVHVYAYRNTSWFRGGAPIHTSWFGGSAYANASWQPVNGLFPFRVAARQALRKKSRTVCCIGLLFLIIRRCRQLLLLVFSIPTAVFCFHGSIPAISKQEAVFCSIVGYFKLSFVMVPLSGYFKLSFVMVPLSGYFEAVFCSIVGYFKLSFVMVPLSGYFEKAVFCDVPLSAISSCLLWWFHCPAISSCLLWWFHCPAISKKLGFVLLCAIFAMVPLSGYFAKSCLLWWFHCPAISSTCVFLSCTQGVIFAVGNFLLFNFYSECHKLLLV